MEFGIYSDAQLQIELSMKEPGFSQSKKVHWLQSLFFTACTSSFVISPAFAEENPSNWELKLKAAYLYHLAQFIDWPESHPKKKSNAINICVIAGEQNLAILKALETREAKGRPIKIRAIDAISHQSSCHMVYYQGDRKTDKSRLFEFHDQSTLTVGGADSFVADGGLVGLVVSDNRVQIQINYERAKQTEIKISANLLELASIVE